MAATLPWWSPFILFVFSSICFQYSPVHVFHVTSLFHDQSCVVIPIVCTYSLFPCVISACLFFIVPHCLSIVCCVFLCHFARLSSVLCVSHLQLFPFPCCCPVSSDWFPGFVLHLFPGYKLPDPHCPVCPLWTLPALDYELPIPHCTLLLVTSPWMTIQ